MRWHALVLTVASLLACNTAPQLDVLPLDILPDHACAVDGMLIAEYDGPKAQLLRANGERALYCDTGEVFAEWLDPVRQRRVAGLWFQILDDAPWAAHAGNWAPAPDLLFVAGSTRMGAMGPTLVPFRQRAAAEAFVQQYGGTIVPFDRVDAAVLQSLRQQGMERLSRD